MVCAPAAFDTLKVQAQSIVMDVQRRQRPIQRLWLKCLQRPQQQRLIPVAGDGHRLGEKMRLNRCDRRLALHWAVVDTGVVQGHRDGCQGSDVLMLEHIAWLELPPGLPCPADHLQGQNGVAAQLEEVVGDTHLLDAQDLGPDRRQGPFDLAARCDVGLDGDLPFGRRQLLAVQLAVGRQRHGFELYEAPWHHVFGHVLA